MSLTTSAVLFPVSNNFLRAKKNSHVKNIVTEHLLCL